MASWEEGTRSMLSLMTTKEEMMRYISTDIESLQKCAIGKPDIQIRIDRVADEAQPFLEGLLLSKEDDIQLTDRDTFMKLEKELLEIHDLLPPEEEVDSNQNWTHEKGYENVTPNENRPKEGWDICCDPRNYETDVFAPNEPQFAQALDWRNDMRNYDLPENLAALDLKDEEDATEN